MLIHEVPIIEEVHITGKESVNELIIRMEENKLNDLPYVEGNELKGYVRHLDLVNLNGDKQITVSNISLHNGIFMVLNDHILNAVRLMSRSNLSSCAVFDENKIFRGTLTDREAWSVLGERFQFGERGSVLVVEFSKEKFLVSDVIRILEAEGGIPMMVFMNPTDFADKIQLTIKLQLFDNQNVVLSLQRYGIHLMNSFEVPDYSEFLSDRYDQLIKYLDI